MIELKQTIVLGKKLVLTTFLLMSYCFSIHAQSLSPESINCAAGTMSQSNGSLSFTIGDLVVLTFTDSEGNTLGGGFINSSTTTTVVSVEEPDRQLLDVNVYPNPTSDLVNIQVNNVNIEKIIVSINDLNGKLVYSGQYAGMTNLIGINIANYSPGTYLLSLKDKDSGVLGVFKIIKQ